MTEYLVKVHFWLLCCDDGIIEAPSDASAVEMAKAAAATVMESHEQPETIDFDERREGSISYIDRIDPRERVEVAGLVRFDDDRLYPAWHDFIENIAASPTGAGVDGAGETDALRHYRGLIEEAKTLRDQIA